LLRRRSEGRKRYGERDRQARVRHPGLRARARPERSSRPSGRCVVSASVDVHGARLAGVVTSTSEESDATGP
jgi:hypothetical protein